MQREYPMYPHYISHQKDLMCEIINVGDSPWFQYFSTSHPKDIIYIIGIHSHQK